ncbi:hypothetical protein [Arthrobacter sp. E3]|uniref:hypothetical protein n=1 Tax=Arthrobacter sp. E3 TaxID=517402 RepID=UPI001A93D293|nr:hypothetical protein [Arthrobacter sp. E3]
MDEDGSGSLDEAARTLEIFLDMLAAESSDTHAFFLAPYYAGGMSDDEQQLRAKLLALATEQSLASTSSAWIVLEQSFLAMGWDPEHSYT